MVPVPLKKNVVVISDELNAVLRMSSGRTSAQTHGATAGAVPRPTRAPSLVLRTSRRGKMGQVAGLFTI